MYFLWGVVADFVEAGEGLGGETVHRVLGPAYVDEWMGGSAFQKKNPGSAYEEFDIA